MLFVLLAIVPALLAALPLCSAQQQDNASFVGADANGQLLFSDANVSVTLRALVAQLSTLAAGQSALQTAVQAGLSTVVVGQTALVNEVCRFQGRTSVFQSIPTQGARAWEFFSINNHSYLAVANWYNGNSYSINSQILRFDGSSFVHFQSIPTQGALDWEFFSIAGQSFLAVANHHSALTTFSINSQILRVDGSSFAPFQLVPTQGAMDWKFF
jgi:hypothetical protein